MITKQRLQKATLAMVLAAAFLMLAGCSQEPAAPSQPVSEATSEPASQPTSETTTPPVMSVEDALARFQATVQIEIDEENNIEKRSYFDFDGNKIINNNGFHIIEAKKDENGVIIGTAIFDVDGNPITAADGSTATAYETDESGNVTRVDFFDVEGNAVLTSFGNAYYTQEFDENSNITSIAHYDLDDEPVLSIEGFFRVEFEYNEDGSLTKEEYFDLEGELVATPYGYATAILEYYDNGSIKSESYYGTNGELVDCAENYAYYEAAYNGDELDVTYYTADGEVAMHAGGYSKIRINEESGVEVKRTYLDADGVAVFVPSLGYSGYETRSEQVSYGYVDYYDYFDENGQLIESQIYAMSEDGLYVVERFEDADKNPIESKIYGYAHGYLHFSLVGTLQHALFFDLEMNPIEF